MCRSMPRNAINGSLEVLAMLPQLKFMYVLTYSQSLSDIILLLRPCAVTCRTIGSAEHWSRSPRFVG